MRGSNRTYRADVGRCRTCGQVIVWYHTVEGRRMPVDPEAHPDGNLRVYGDGRALVLGRTELAEHQAAGTERYRPHTCPQTTTHRRR